MFETGWGRGWGWRQRLIIFSLGWGGGGAIFGTVRNRSFPGCFEPHYESEAKCKFFFMNISFNS